MKWTWYDFQANGTNEVLVALERLAPTRKELDKLKARIQKCFAFFELETMRQNPAHFEPRHDCPDAIEMKFKFNRVQVRPLFYYGPDRRNNEVTILAIATKKNNRLVPSGICATVQNRMGQVERDRRYIAPHDY